MIQKLLIKKISDLIMKQVFKQSDKLEKKLETIEGKIEKLEKLAHPVADFICTDCGTKAKRVKSKLNKIKEKI